MYDDQNVRLWLKKGLLVSSNPEVNYLTAVSDKQFWVLLCNESRQDVATTLSPGDEIAALVNVPKAKIIGKAASLETDNNLKVNLPAKGFAAVTIPLANGAVDSPFLGAVLGVNATPALKNGWKVTDSGTAAGKIYMFRIRSPFGWDSVYGFCETPPADGILVEVECNGRKCAIEEYPYEWSFAKFRPADSVKISVKVSDSEGKVKRHDIEM